MSEVTEILEEFRAGDSDASDRLLSATYNELRAVAAGMMARENADHTLQPTALIHEAYLKLATANGDLPELQSRKRFFGAAAEAMRRILIDHARRKRSQKRGGNLERTTWDEAKFDWEPPTDEMLAVHETLAKLEGENPDAATVVKLRYFGGMTAEETAKALGVSESTVHRTWRSARAWLFLEISGDDG